jgi:two-component system, OmpR family, response regulator VicR
LHPFLAYWYTITHMDEDKKRVLIVEDDQHISKVYEIQLAKEGLLSILAHDGEEGIRLFAAEKPDIVVLDLMLPKKDGFEVLEEIRKNSELQKIPVIVISNLGQDEDKKRALDLGATDYLVKVDHPIQEIITKIKERLSTQAI